MILKPNTGLDVSHWKKGLEIAKLTPSAVSSDITKAAIQFVNSGTQSATPGLASISAGATTVQLFRDWTGLTWTNTGTKNANFSFQYNL